MTETSELEDEIQMLRREREQLGMRLLELQQRVASASASELERRIRDGDMVEAELRRQIRELEAENAAIRDSFVWRASAPARRVRRYFR
jgi:chromosome segregation ATPase